MASFQESVAGLCQFWQEQGHVLLAPTDSRLPSGLMAPDVFFRLFGPVRVKAAQVVAVCRPWDGRLAKNGLRLGRHTQLQVVSKPPALGDRALVLASLEAAGIELSQRDVRFVPRPAHQRPLGIRGQGWRIVVDGVEVGRMSYVQEAAGLTLEPVCLDLCFGLERLVMRQQGVSRIADLEWGFGSRYGELYFDDERQASIYWLEVAAPAALEEQIASLVGEARRCLAADLVRPAYEAVLQTLHLAEILELRGAEAEAGSTRSAEQAGEEAMIAVADLAADCARRLLERATPEPSPAAEESAASGV